MLLGGQETFALPMTLGSLFDLVFIRMCGGAPADGKPFASTLLASADRQYQIIAGKLKDEYSVGCMRGAGEQTRAA